MNRRVETRPDDELKADRTACEIWYELDIVVVVVLHVRTAEVSLARPLDVRRPDKGVREGLRPQARLTTGADGRGTVVEATL